MPRRHRHRTMKGGFWDSLTQGVSDAWEKTKKASSDAYSSATGSTTSTSSYVPPPPPPTPATSSSGYMGGKKRSRKNRKLRAGMNPEPFKGSLGPSEIIGQHVEGLLPKKLPPKTFKGSLGPSEIIGQRVEGLLPKKLPPKTFKGSLGPSEIIGQQLLYGGYGDNIALTGLAARAAPISDIKSAQPLTTVGGRRTKRRHGGKHRHSKSCKHRKH